MAQDSSTKPLIGLVCRWDDEQGRFYLPREYSEAVSDAGGLPVLIPLIPGIAQELAARLDAVVLTGSPSDVDPSRYGQARYPEVTNIHPARDATDFQVLDQAFREKKPVLGICYGMQSLNVYLGGSLVQHIPATIATAIDHNQDTGRHQVTLQPGSAMISWAGGAGSVEVNSTHHQAVERLGRGLRVAGRAPDGVIEAVEGNFPEHFVWAVQWHPERIRSEDRLSARLFHELVQAARREPEPRP